MLCSYLKDLIIAVEFHGPFFYDLSIVKKRSLSFSALSFGQNGPKLGVLFHSTKSNNFTCSDLN